MHGLDQKTCLDQNKEWAKMNKKMNHLDEIVRSTHISKSESLRK